MLSSARQRLIAVYNQLAGPLAEQQGFINPTLQKQILKGCQASLTAIEKDRKAIDKSIEQLIEGDQQLKELFGLITARRPGSIPGIGPATATEVVIATNERPPLRLKSITDPKKMAASAVRLPCWSGSLQLPIGQQCSRSAWCEPARPQAAQVSFSFSSHVLNPRKRGITGLLPTESQRGKEQNASFERRAQQVDPPDLCRCQAR